MKKSEGAIKIIAKNKKAFFNYEIHERYESGIELRGSEVKSLRQSKVNLLDSYCKIKDGELFLIGMDIAPYIHGGYINHAPKRKRKILLHKHEIEKLSNKLILRGFTLIPISMYFKRGWAKIELGLARGKKKYDKRDSIRQKEAKKDLREY